MNSGSPAPVSNAHQAISGISYSICLPEIFDSVVGRVLVNVVDLLWPSAVVHTPNYAMRLHLTKPIGRADAITLSIVSRERLFACKCGIEFPTVRFRIFAVSEQIGRPLAPKQLSGLRFIPEHLEQMMQLV